MSSSTNPNDERNSGQEIALTDIQRGIKQLQDEVEKMRYIMENMRRQSKETENSQWSRIFDLQADIIQAKVQASINTKSRLSQLADIIESGIFITIVFLAMIVMREKLVDM